MQVQVYSSLAAQDKADRAYWAAIPVATRVLEVWTLSEEQWRLRGEFRMNQDFDDLLRAFIDDDVRFLIVGAYALALHGRPRATGDLDVVDGPDARTRRASSPALSAGSAHPGQRAVSTSPSLGRVADRRVTRTNRHPDRAHRARVRRGVADGRLRAPLAHWRRLPRARRVHPEQEGHRPNEGPRRHRRTPVTPGAGLAGIQRSGPLPTPVDHDQRHIVCEAAGAGPGRQIGNHVGQYLVRGDGSPGG